jgi:hypothetical protein
MSQRSSGPAGPGSDDWPDDLWPGDDDSPSGPGGPTGGGAAGGPQAPPPRPAGGPEDRLPGRRFRPALLLVIALLAAAAGAGIVLAVNGLSGPSGVSPGPAGQPSSLTPVAPGGNGQPSGGALPGTGSGGTGTLFVIGKVTAVSSRSITIGGAAHTVTAAVTSSTRVTGKVSSVGAVKVGDQVSAQITQNGGGATATAIQDPAQSPPGGSAP